VRLPKEYRFEGDEVSIRREDDRVILETLHPRSWPEGYWESWGRASVDLEVPEALPAGGGPIDVDPR